MEALGDMEALEDMEVLGEMEALTLELGDTEALGDIDADVDELILELGEADELGEVEAETEALGEMDGGVSPLTTTVRPIEYSIVFNVQIPGSFVATASEIHDELTEALSPVAPPASM